MSQENARSLPAIERYVGPRMPCANPKGYLQPPCPFPATYRVFWAAGARRAGQASRHICQHHAKRWASRHAMKMPEDPA